MLSHSCLAMAGATGLMLACGLTVGVGQAATGTGAAITRDLAAALGRRPAVWIMIAVTVALCGVRKRLACIGWAVMVAAFLASGIGPLVDLPDWIRSSPAGASASGRC